jgi:hypothetical protein
MTMTRGGGGWRVLVRPDGYIPATERILPPGGSLRVVGIGLFVALPFIHLLAVWLLERATGVTSAGAEVLIDLLPGRFLNAYLTVLTLWGAAHVAARLREVRELTPEDVGPPADWRTWLLVPLLFMVVFTIGYEAERVSALPVSGRSVIPASVVSIGLSLLIRLPQASAFWTVVVALLAIARMHRLPGTFPEDRTLGLRPVGALVTTTLLLYAAAFSPTFIVGVDRLTDLVLTGFVFVLGIGAIVLAVSRLHAGMVEERTRQVAEARARYARAYRAVAHAGAAGKTSAEAQAVELQAAGALLQGAESIYAWPFDEGMQRIAGIVLTGVVTGVVIRLIFLALGY